MVQNTGWDEVQEEPENPIEIWDETAPTQQPESTFKVSDSAGSAALVASAVGGGVDTPKIKATFEAGEPDQLLREASQIVLRNKESAERVMFNDALAKGDSEAAVKAYSSIVDSINAARTEANARQAYAQLTQQALENAAKADPRTTIPEGTSIGDTTDAHMADSAKASEQTGFVVNIKKWGEFVVKGILLETVYRNKVVESAKRAFFLPGSTTGYYWSTNSMYEDIRGALDNMSSEQQAEALNRYYKFGIENGADQITLLASIASITDMGNIEEAIVGIGDVAGPLMDAMAGAGLITKISRGMKSKNALEAIGDVSGGRGTGKIVADEMSKGTMSAEEVLSYSTSLSPRNVLPEGVFGTSAEVQSRIVADTSKLLEDLKNRISSQTVYTPELNNMVEELKSTFDPNINKAIRSYDVEKTSENGIQGTVTWANKDGASYATEAAAHEFAKRRGMTNYEVIKDTSSSGFSVKQPIIDAYKAELKAINDKLGAAPSAKIGKSVTVYHGSTASTRIQALNERFIGTGEGKATEGYGFYFSSDRTLAGKHAQLSETGGAVYRTEVNSDNLFSWNGYVSESSKRTQSNILKAIKEIAPDEYNFYKTNGLNITGRELYRDILQGSSNPKRASDTLAKYGVDGHTVDNMGESFNYDALAQGVEGQHVNYVLYPRAGEVPVTHIDDVSIPKAAGTKVFTQEEWDDTLDALIAKKHAYDNAWAGKSGGVLKNMNNSIKVSNDIGKKASEAIVAWHKMLGLSGRKLVVVTSQEASKLASKFKDMELATIALNKTDKNTNAVYYTFNGVSYIVTNTKVNTNGGLYTLAHEFGHFFEAAFASKYSKQIEAAYMKWKKSHLPNGEWENISTSDEMSKAMLFRGPGDRGLPGNAWGDVDPGTQAWLSAKEEWFAEQFANWLLTDKIPRSQFEHLLKALMDNLLKFAEDVAERLGVPIDESSRFISKFMNDHVTANLKVKKTDLEDAKKLADSVARRDELVKLIKEAEDAAKLPYHGYLVREHRLDDIKYDSLGGFTEEDISSSFWIGIDPKHLVSEFLVEGRVIGIHQEAKMQKALSTFMIESIDPLNKTELQRVTAVLKKGDSYSEAGGVGKEFSSVELTGMGLSEKEQEAYFRLRTARNVMFELKDDEFARALRKQGYKQIGIDFGGGKTFVSTGREVVSPTIHSTVYDVNSKSRVIVDAAYIKEVKDTGRKFVRIEERTTPEGETSAFRTFVVDNDNSTITDIRNVLHKRPGEFSRIYTDEYFITLTKKVDTDGVAETLVDTIHTAGSKADADAFVKGMNLLSKQDPTTLTIKQVEDAVGQWVSPDVILKEFQDGKYAGAEFAQHYNRINEEYVTNFSRGLEGSMFTGRRGQRLTSISENKENIQDIYGSLQAELTNTAKVIGRTDWRNAAIQRWYNQAMKAGALPESMRALSPTQAFEWAGQTDFRYVGSGKEGKFLERTHKYIRMQLGMRTKDEEMFEAATRIFTEKYITPKMGGKVEAIGKLLRTSSPTSFLRTINFHAMLGFMNPSQLFVQTMGAVAAIALHPIHGVASGKAAPLLRLGLMSDNPEVWHTMAKINNFAELGFGSTEDFINTIKGIRKAGILDGLHSTSLHNIEAGTYNVFGGFKRKASKASLFTFNRGEEMARIISFDVARKEWQAANAGKDFLSDDALRSIVIRMDDFTQNMTKANETFFQRGILSIPSQFLQYQVKLYANITSSFFTSKGAGHRGFTRAEAAKILAGHVVLFGVANNGLGSMVEETFGEMATEANLDENARFALSQGLIASLLDQASQAITGEELKTSIGARLAAFDWYLNYVEGLTEKSVLEMASGPSYSWIRSGDKTANILSMWVKNPNTSFSEVLDGLKQIGETQISTWRNATKAYVASMHGNTLQNSTGDDVAVLSNSELLFQALGIAPIEIYEKNKIEKSMSQRYDTLRQLANTIAVQQQRAANAYLEGDEELGKQLSLSAVSLIPDNAGDRDYVLRNLKKMQKENKGYNEALAKYLMKDLDISQPFLTEDISGEK